MVKKKRNHELLLDHKKQRWPFSLQVFFFFYCFYFGHPKSMCSKLVYRLPNWPEIPGIHLQSGSPVFLFFRKIKIIFYNFFYNLRCNLRIRLFVEKSCLIFDIFIFIFWIHSIIKSCDVMMDRSAWGKVLFWLYLLNFKLFGRKTWPTNSIVMAIVFRKKFVWFEGLSLKSILFNLPIYCSLSKTSFDELVLFRCCFGRYTLRQSKIVNII